MPALDVTSPRSASTVPLPSWVRSLVCVWIVLFGALSCVQATHSHGALPIPMAAKAASAKTVGHTPLARTASVHAPAQAQLPDGDENCPLCLAMHLAIPATSTPVAMVAFSALPALTPTAQLRPALGLWHYDLFGRPPPASTLS